VPVGTQVFEEDETTLIADLEKGGDIVLLAQGGSGGFGNARFKSSTNRAPRRANPGLPAEHRTIWLRLKLIADVGLVGLPNAGKSTFLAAATSATPKIADYPFTTLYPGLGVVRIGDGDSYVLADIPGLIEGAHEGAGIGDRFLGHIERCAAILHLVDAGHDDVTASYDIVREELKAYGHSLDEKFERIALSKADTVDDELLIEKQKQLQDHTGKPVEILSAVTHQGLFSTLRDLGNLAKEQRINNKKEEPAAWTP